MFSNQAASKRTLLRASALAIVVASQRRFMEADSGAELGLSDKDGIWMRQVGPFNSRH
jgi:hypothetical protein